MDGWKDGAGIENGGMDGVGKINGLMGRWIDD